MNRPDAWNPLREFTDARIALGRSGASLPTREVLNFGLSSAIFRRCTISTRWPCCARRRRRWC